MYVARRFPQTVEFSGALVANEAAGETHGSCSTRLSVPGASAAPARGRAPLPLQHRLPSGQSATQTSRAWFCTLLGSWLTTVKKWITNLSLRWVYIRNLAVCQDRGEKRKLGRKRTKKCKKVTWRTPRN